MGNDGWKSHTFDELISLGVLILSDGYRAKLEELGGDGPMFLRAGHVSDSHIDFREVERFQAGLERRVRGKMSQPGDVVITTKGNSTGRVAFVSESLPQFVYSPHLSFWRSVKTDALVPGFLRYWSRGEEFRQQLRALSSSTDMAPYLSLVDQRRLRLTLPPAQEQRAIALVLGALDDKIELNRRMNETLEALAQALFKSWFVDATQSALPKGWRETKLGEHVEVVKGLSYKGSGLADEGIPLHNLNSIYEGGRYKHEGLKHYTGEHKDRHVIHPGDVIVANTEQGHDYLLIGYPAIVPKCYGKFGLFTHHTYRVRPLPESALTSHFIYLALMSPAVREQVIGHTNGTTVNALAKSGIEEAKFILPPSEHISNFDKIVAPMFAKQENLHEESSTIAALRDALLPKLLSGELRVPLNNQ